MRRYTVIFFLFLLLPVLRVFPQTPPYQFTHIDIDQGLSNNQVNCIFKDSKGFMWFGTISGLNRYDGYTFRIFKHDLRDSTSLPDNFIERITEAPGGLLWIYARDGQHVYDPARDAFLSAQPVLQQMGIPGAVVNVWARLLDGNHAYKLLRELLKISSNDATDYHNAGGTYSNLFCAHPPFQIDGNFGGTSGITEMLLQSQLNAIQLLPAIPDAWASGEVKGLVARGGFVIDMQWADGKLKKAIILAKNSGPCRLRVLQPVKGSNNLALSALKGDGAGYLYTFNTTAGNVYTLIAE